LLWTERAVIALRSIPAVAKYAVKTKAEMERSAITELESAVRRIEEKLQ